MLKKTYTFDEVQKRAVSLYEHTHSFRKVGIEMGVSCATARRIYNGEEPVQRRIRDALSMATMKPAPACHKCGVVHVSKRCTAARQLPEPYEFLVQWLVEREKARMK